MKGPTTPSEALSWIKVAVQSGRYLIHEAHMHKRMAQRHVTLQDLRVALLRATRCKPYTPAFRHTDGTAWRVIGRDVDGDELTVGCEAFEDHVGRRVLVITVF